MQVHSVKSGIVCASNGGCDAFDINRSLAEGIVEINQGFLDSSLASLALGIITMQKSMPYSATKKRVSTDYVEFVSNLEI